MYICNLQDASKSIQLHQIIMQVKYCLDSWILTEALPAFRFSLFLFFVSLSLSLSLSFPLPTEGYLEPELLERSLESVLVSRLVYVALSVILFFCFLDTLARLSEFDGMMPSEIQQIAEEEQQLSARHVLIR